MARSWRDRLVRLLFPAPALRSGSHGPPSRILVIRPDHLGDLLFATPALTHLRAAYPQAHISGLVGPWGQVVWQRQPMLDEVLTIPFPGIHARPTRPWQPYTFLRSQARLLAQGNYDLAVILRFDYWWGALLAEQAGIARRWGYDQPANRPYLTHALGYEEGRHEVEQNMALVAAVAPEPPIPSVERNTGRPPLLFPRTAEETAWAETQLGPAATRTVLIHPGTNGSLKLWTLDGWATVARWLLQHGYDVILSGSPAEIPLVEAIRACLQPDEAERVRNMAGETTLGQLAALAAECRAVLGVDSGPLHIATAVGAATLRLYGPSDENIWGPWGPVARNITVRASGTVPGRFLDPDRQALEGGPPMQAITAQQVLQPLARMLGA